MYKIKAKLGIIFFKEGKKFIAYSPAIDLSTYGNTFDQAKKRFAEAADIFFKETIKLGTIEDVLKECGWKKVSRPRIHWVPPTIIGQSEKEITVSA